MSSPDRGPDLDVLEEIRRRALWLAVRIVDAANRERDTGDGASHAMSWRGSAIGVPAVPLGVDAFGQSGSLHEPYELRDRPPGSIVNAAPAAAPSLR